MRATKATDAGVESKARALKILMMVWALQAAVVASAQWPLLITPTNTTWRYFINGTDPGAEWALPGFEDSSWPEGRGLFGNDTGYPYPFATPIPGPSQGGPMTAYFRTHFTWSGWPVGMVLVATNYFDDGIVIYLNGVELTRYNMPTGPVGHDTPAPGALIEPVVRVHVMALDALTNGNANPLVAGLNVLAASVHNNSSGSSDTVFGLSLSTQQCMPACTDGLHPTNRMVLEGRTTTFALSQSGNCAFPVPTFQWYRNVGAGEELIVGATTSSYTLTNAMPGVDDGVYYCRLTSTCGTVDSRQALLTIFSDPSPPIFLSASVIGPGLNTFRLITDEPLCGNGDPPPVGCGSDFKFGLNWQILQADNLSIDLGVASVTQISPTTYEFTTSFSRDPSKLYQITVTPEFGEIGDLFGNLVPPGTFAQTLPTLTFSQGLAGYSGTQDAEIHSMALADTPLGAALQMRSDLDNNGVAQSLLRFDNIIGSGTNQIPFGSRVLSATLTLHQADPGSAVNLHRMLVDWNQSTATWNSLLEGITANDEEARIIPDATKLADATNGRIDLDVTASVQAWVSGQPNFGWALLATGTDGWDVSTSESGVSTAPLLTIEHFYLYECSVPIIVTQPPASVVLQELQTFTLAVVVSNASGIFQWSRNGVDIPGATGPSYTINSATPADSGTYRLRISCPPGVTVAISSPSVVIVGESFRPHLIGAMTESDNVTVKLRFSQPLNQASAENLANYSFVPPLAVLGADYSNSSVTLTTASRSLLGVTCCASPMWPTAAPPQT